MTDSINEEPDLDDDELEVVSGGRNSSGATCNVQHPLGRGETTALDRWSS